MIADKLYYCTRCPFKHVSLQTLAEHNRDAHREPVEPQPKPEGER